MSLTFISEQKRQKLSGVISTKTFRDKTCSYKHSSSFLLSASKSVKMSQALMAKPSVVRCKVLVVDADSTSLSTVSAMLKRWLYDVVTVKRPVDALAIIRILQDVDLVVTELHLPDVNGLELQKQIDEEFNLPVIVMSSDDRESVIMKSLESGVVFYMVKPVNPDVLKNVWQFVVTSKKGESVLVSASSVVEQKKNKKASKGKSVCVTADQRKARVAWNYELHKKFLHAITHISRRERAVPKNILEFMNVPGLTRGHVASHLQRYRIILTQVAEKGTSASSSIVSGNNCVSQLGWLGNQATTLFSTGSYNMGDNSMLFGGTSGGIIMNDNTGCSSIKGFGTWGGENTETINNNPYSNYAGIGLNNDGEFFATDQTIHSGIGLDGSYGLTNGTAGFMGNGAFGHLAPGESSSSAGFGNGQANASVMPPLLSQQQHSLGNDGQNDLTFGLMNNTNASIFLGNGNTAHPEQFDHQLILYQAELNLPINQSQSPDISEPTLEQHQGNQSNMKSELNGPYPCESSLSGDQVWDEDFINSLLSDDT